LGGGRSANYVFFLCCSSYSKWITSELEGRFPKYFGNDPEVETDEELKKKKEKVKGIRTAIKSYDKYWFTILWCMTEGDASAQKQLLRTDVLDFYGMMEVHEHIIEKRLKDIEKRRSKQK